VTDLKTADQLAPAIEALSDLPIHYTLGGHKTEELVEADLVVVNPAVPRHSKLLQACHKARVPLTSEMNMFLALCRAPVAAVTGSVGKSTTTAMLATMLRAGGHTVHLGGNIGICLLPLVDDITPDDFVVLEISSFQLEDAACLEWSPHVAVVTNITPNHLDRYGTCEAYVNAKRSIVTFQTQGDAAVLNRNDAALQEWAAAGTPGELLFFDAESTTGPLARGMNLRAGRLIWNKGDVQQLICSADQIAVPGAHNVANALAAGAAACWLDVPAEFIRQALCEFKPLEHRLEKCGACQGTTFYNDSDATAPESTIAGLRTFKAPVTLIAGGYNKGLDLRPMAAAIADHARVLITLGTAGPEIAELTRQAAARAGRTPVIKEVKSLEEGVRAAFDLSVPGSTVLFSPACASFDMFQNFAERGRKFKELVAAVIKERTSARAI
jgi:UDP-N-acetylmuramoylalanine--D-glutamate ligase